MILEEVGRNPLDVSLGHIVKDLLLFFNGFECLHEAKGMIEKKCDIKKETEHKCWPEDDIKRAWKETKTMNIKSSRRRHWARVIILQIVKSFVCDTCKQNAAQENRHATTDEPGCEMRPNTEDTSSQSKADLETVGVAGGVEQTLENEKKISKVSKLSASSTDVASLPTEVNSSNSETKNAALVSESEALVNKSEQQKDVDYYELRFVNVHDKENVRRKNGLHSTCGEAQSMKGNSKMRSTQSSDELETVGAAGGNHPTSRHLWPTTANQSTTGTQFQYLVRSQATGNVAPGGRTRTLENEDEENIRINDTFYIRIPYLRMFANEPTFRVHNVTNAQNTFHHMLINGFPSNNTVHITRSYAMSFDNDTGNAELVYEVLNSNTLVNHCVQGDFGNGYVKGHLAAAANHKWCREANNDANLFSNIIPQNSELNNTTWKTLENKCRKMTRNNVIRNVHVYTGPLYLIDVDWRLNGKRVPSHLFKVIIVENVNGTVREPECYVMRNEEPQMDDLTSVPIQYIESLSGLIFMEPRLNLGTDGIMMVTLQGEDLNQMQCNANIEVRITYAN